MEAPKWFITHVVGASAAALCGDDEAAAEARQRLIALSPQFESDGLALIAVWRFDPAVARSAAARPAAEPASSRAEG